MMLALLLAGACRSPDPPPPPPPPPPTPTGATADTGPVWDPGPVLQFDGDAPANLLFISIDTLRQDHFTRYAGDPDLTPNMDAVFAESVLWDDHLQCSNWTWSSVGCTLLGKEHVDNGFMPRLIGAKEPYPPETEFLAGYLNEFGFASLVLASNAWLSDLWGTTIGYDRSIYPAGNSATRVTARGLDALPEIIEEEQAERWFLHLHFLEPHAPYAAPVEYRRGEELLDPLHINIDSQGSHYGALAQWPTMTPDEQANLEAHLRMRYAAEVRWLDDKFAEAWTQLEDGGWLDDTLVVIWTDHGEQFWEHGHQTHAWDLGPEENRAVVAMWAKNLAPASWTGPTTAIDVAPTALAALDLPVPEGMTGTVLGLAPADRPRFASTVGRNGPIQSVHRSGWQLVYHWTTGSVQLYDTAADPEARTDLFSPDHPELAGLWDTLLPRIAAARILLPGEAQIWPEFYAP